MELSSPSGTTRSIDGKLNVPRTFHDKVQDRRGGGRDEDRGRERASLPGGFGIDRTQKERRRREKRRRGVHEKFETPGVARRRNVIRYARKDVLISETRRRFSSTGAIAARHVAISRQLGFVWLRTTSCSENTSRDFLSGRAAAVPALRNAPETGRTNFYGIRAGPNAAWASDIGCFGDYVSLLDTGKQCARGLGGNRGIRGHSSFRAAIFGLSNGLRAMEDSLLVRID